MKESRLARLPFFYGWVIVGLGVFSTAFWMGVITSFSVFFVALTEEFHWSRGGTAGVQSMALLTYTAMAPIVGRLIDHYGPKKTILPGIVILSAGLTLCSLVRNLLTFYIFYGVFVAVGFTFVSIVSYSTILSYWFERKRGIASGIAVSGMGLGTFLLIPLCQYLINSHGWRFSYACFGGLAFLILFPLSAIFLKHKPEDLGLQVDGATVTGRRTIRRVQVRDDKWAGTVWTVSKAFKEVRFWAFLAFCFLSMTGLYGLLIHEVRFLVDCGLGKMAAAYIVSLIGIISLFARIFWGWLSDRIGREYTVTAGTAFLSTAAVFLLLLGRSHETHTYVYLFAVAFGLGWAVMAPMFMAVAADLFQGENFGSIYGVVEAVIGSGSAVGAWLAGFIYDKTGSYSTAFLYAAIISLVSCIFVWVAGPGRVRRTRTVHIEGTAGGSSL
jgi:MFS family permease